jgi:hypothetical protein
MKKKIVFSLLIVIILAAAAGSSAYGGGTTTATSFVVQNLGNAEAGVTIDYRGATSGTVQDTQTMSITVGAAANFDQRFQANLPSGFIGGAVVSSGQPIGAVVNLLRAATTSGAVNAYESYNGFGSTNVGQSIRLPQILKNVSSAGLAYNTQISVQNTDTVNPASVTLKFTPDPTINPVVCKSPSQCISSPYTTPAIPIPAGGVYNLDQGGQSNSQIGDVFFGSVLVTETTGRNVAVQVIATGASGGLDQQLLAYPSYVGGTTNPIALPSVYKNIVSLGDSYSTAFLIANFGSSDATVAITYTAGSIGTASATPDTIIVPANGVKNVDQRGDAPAITSANFLGSAIAQSTNGQPIAIMVNLRGGSRFAMTYDGIAGGGTKVYLPVGYKNINSQGYSWSSTMIVHNFGASAANVTVDYLDNRSGKPSATGVTLGTIQPGGTIQYDLRFDASISTLPDFFGAIVLTSTNGQPIAAMVQSRGANGSGDSLLAYKGLTP